MQNPTWYNNQVHGCCNIAVQSCYFIIPWQHVQSCMNMAVDLSPWFQQHCSSLFVHQAMNSLFQHAWTSLSTTMHVQAGQLNHVQACQQAKTSCVFLRVYVYFTILKIGCAWVLCNSSMVKFMESLLTWHIWSSALALSLYHKRSCKIRADLYLYIIKFIKDSWRKFKRNEYLISVWIFNKRFVLIYINFIFVFLG